MKCPICGGNLERGHLNAGGYRIIWTEQVRRWSSLRGPGDRMVEPFHISGKLKNTADRCLQCGMIFVTPAGEKKHDP